MNACKHCGSDMRRSPCCGRGEGLSHELTRLRSEVARLNAEVEVATKTADITNEAMHSLAEIISDLSYRQRMGTASDDPPDFACMHCMAYEGEPHLQNCPIGDAITSKNEVMDAVKRDLQALTPTDPPRG